MSWMIVRAEPRAGTLTSMPFGADRLELDRVGVLDVEPIADRLDRRHAAKHLERHLARSSATRAAAPTCGRFRRASPRCRRTRCRASPSRRRTAAPRASAPSRLMPPSAISGTPCRRGQPAVDERLHLRHAEVRGQARGAAAAGADADLDAVDAALDQEPRALGRARRCRRPARRRRTACAAARSRAPSPPSGRARCR